LRILQHIERICQAIDIENFWEYNPLWLKEEKMISYVNFWESMVYITFPCKGDQQWFSFPIDFQHLNIQRTPFKGVLFLYAELTLRIEYLLSSDISFGRMPMRKPPQRSEDQTSSVAPAGANILNLNQFGIYTKLILKAE
ncbi:hypothetical protein, partial [Athalassotoga sp.]|uniref:hypothetical protein n=1 Tax=Athalassotoga sp. TaxID=2022597 RepID=UPI003D0635EF